MIEQGVNAEQIQPRLVVLFAAEKVIILGHSFGANLATLFLAAYPEVVTNYKIRLENHCDKKRF